MPSSDYKVELVDANGDPDWTVTVVGDQVVDLTGATDGQVLTVQADGTVAPENPASVPPNGAAGGVLSGTYPNPGFAVDMATQAELDAKVTDAIADGATTVAPSQNAVFDALALKAPLTPTVGTGLGTSGTVNLDFSTLNGTFQTIALSGDITFTTSNLAAGRSVSLFISAAATRTFTFPAWLFVGAAAPASVLAGKAGVLTLTATTNADGGVYAAWAATP